MNNIFLQLKSSFVFKQEPIKKILANDPQKAELTQIMSKFYESKPSEPLQFAHLVRDLACNTQSKETIEKLLHLLVYFATLLSSQDLIEILHSLGKGSISQYSLVKFYAFVFKSVKDQELKRKCIELSLQAMCKEEKTSPFSSFVENFPAIVSSLNLPAQESIALYWRLIQYLDKHPVYKQTASKHVFQALSLVRTAEESAKNSEIVTNLLIRAIMTENFADSAIDVLNQEQIQKHGLYPVLEARMTGDIEAGEKVAVWEKFGLEKSRVMRKIKVEAIPRLFKHIRRASYVQAAEMLKVEKAEVEGYIIEAIRLGIIRAKLDEFEETIIVNKILMRCLQKNEQIELQREISSLCSRLSHIE